MEGTFLTNVLLPIALGIIMLGMGLSLTLADFRDVLKRPKAVGVGILCQMVLLPLLGFAVANALSMPPALGIGLMILTFCPGGTTSNIMTFLGRGDIAVSVSLTAVVSVVTPFTIPLLYGLVASDLDPNAAHTEMPLFETVGKLLAITIVPVAIGMALRSRFPDFAARAERPVKIFSIVVLIAIIAGIFKQNWDKVPDFFAQAGVAAVVLNLAAMALGYGIARAVRLNRAQTTAITIEVGIQNGTLALLITLSILKNAELAIPAAVYSLIMFFTGGAFAWWASRRAEASAA